jgi:hypothetical protein
MRVCAVTNVFNEAFNLPIWLRHYGAQVGIENCLVVDHGSNDGSTADLGGAGVIRLPRSPFNDHKRARMIAGLVGSLLPAYDAMLYSDCDELLVADPAKYANLVAFCEAFEGKAATAIGLNVIHHLGLHNPIRLDRPLLGQRSLVQFVSPMCKTLLTKVPITWTGGFHASSQPVRFDDLYLFHIRWIDLGESIKRLATTRAIEFSDDRAGLHQRADYMRFVEIFQRMANLPVSENFDLADLLNRVRAAAALNDAGVYALKPDVRSEGLLRVPERFLSVF